MPQLLILLKVRPHYCTEFLLLTIHLKSVTRNYVKGKTIKQNITLAVDKDLLKKARVLAAKRETSVSKLLSEQLAKIVSEDNQYEASQKRALSRLRKGFRLGGRILATRDELHERK